MPEKLVMGPLNVPEEGPLQEGLQSAALGSEGDRKQNHAAHGFGRIPCLGNRLPQYLASTVAPPGDKTREQIMPPRKANTLLWKPRHC